MINDAPRIPLGLSKQLRMAVVECSTGGLSEPPALLEAPGLLSLPREMSVPTISQHSAQISPKGNKRFGPASHPPTEGAERLQRPTT